MKVSVALLAYNHEKYIAQAIEGVLMQVTDFDYEVIIGEDCSTDRTRQIIVDYQKRFPHKIKPLFHNTNQGARKNSLGTLKHGKGQYVAFLDGDDYWTSPYKLQRQVDFLDSHPESSMCIHKVQVVTEGGMWSNHPRLTKSIYTLEDLLMANYIPSCSPMYRGTILRQFSWPPGITGEINGDRVFYVWHAQFGKISCLDEVMGVRRVHSGGMWSSLDGLERSSWKANTFVLLQKMLNSRYEPIIKRILAKAYQSMAYGYATNGNKMESHKYLLKSLMTSPWNRCILSWQFAAILIRLYCPVFVSPLVALKKKLSIARFPLI